jgi:ArsR family transcriptional regulator
MLLNNLQMQVPISTESPIRYQEEYYTMNHSSCSNQERKTGLPQNIPPEVQACMSENGGMEGLAELVMSPEDIAKNSELFKALADPFRIKILSLLSIQPLCVCVIREFLQISDTRLSYHLKKLSSLNLISGNPQGNWIIYTITDRGNLALSLCIDHLTLDETD